jgi:hypothetical protein
MLLSDRHGCYYVIGMNVIERSPCVGICMAASLKGYTASQLSFHMASVYLLHELSCLPFVSPGMVPGRVAELDKQAEQFKLPARRERSYPRCIKAKPQKYATRKPSKNNASQA